MGRAPVDHDATRLATGANGYGPSSRRRFRCGGGTWSTWRSSSESTRICSRYRYRSCGRNGAYKGYASRTGCRA